MPIKSRLVVTGAVAIIFMAALGPAQAEQKWLACAFASRLPNGVPAGVPTPETPHSRIFVFDDAQNRLLEFVSGRIEPRASRLDLTNNRIGAQTDPGAAAESISIDRITGKISIDHCLWGRINGQMIQDCSEVDWNEFGSCQPTAPQASAKPLF